MANIISTILRDEDNVVIDFVVFHLSRGFDKIILYDDLSKTPVSSLIDKLPHSLKNCVKVERLPCNFDELNKASTRLFDAELYEDFKYSKQMYFCNFVIRHECEADDWIAFIDVDEFFWFPKFRNIGAFRASVLDRGYSAVVLTMCMYGHSFNITPPLHNNICSYIWRASRLHAHGKFFAHVGSLGLVKTPHLPNLTHGSKMCNALYEERYDEYDHDLPRRADLSMPHLKHYTIMDVYSCFKRRMRVPVSHSVRFKATDDAWKIRVEMIRWTSAEIDIQLACSLIQFRAFHKLEFEDHVFGLSEAVARVSLVENYSSTLDFELLRKKLDLNDDMPNESVLFEYFMRDDHDLGYLEFKPLPPDFNHEKYRTLNGDLSEMSQTQLKQHYANYGRFEGRSYK